MKKHIFAFICVFVLMFNTFTYTQTKAMDIGVAIDVGSEILYEGWDMIQSIFNGFIISLGQYAGYADKASAMAAFYNDWGDVLTILTKGYLSPDQVETPAISGTVYPLDFGMTNASMRDFINQYGYFVYDPTLGVYADINQKSIAAWNRFNDGWVKKYMDAFNKDLDNHPVNPDPDYISYINKMNARDQDDPSTFWFYNLTDSFNYSGNQNVLFKLYNYPIGLFSYCVANPSTNITFSYQGQPFFRVCDILDLSIVSYNGTYSLYKEIVPINIAGEQYNRNLLSSQFKGVNFTAYSGNLFELGNNNSWSENIIFQCNGTLQDCLDYCSKKFKNVNIYVDGQLWSYVGHTEEPIIQLGFDHPSYDENGQIIGNDVFFPEQDLKADIVKFTELIDDKILTGDTIDLDDLIDAGVLTDANGNIITDENRDEYIKKKEISTIITDALDDDIVTDLLPDAPSPPDDDPWNWHFPTIVIPEGGDPDPRGTGISVLARIINVTNQSLPAEVITMFWGICITMLILGIIKILHK